MVPDGLYMVSDILHMVCDSLYMVPDNPYMIPNPYMVSKWVSFTMSVNEVF